MVTKKWFLYDFSNGYFAPTLCNSSFETLAVAKKFVKLDPEFEAINPVTNESIRFDENSGNFVIETLDEVVKALLSSGNTKDAENVKWLFEKVAKLKKLNGDKIKNENRKRM